MEDDVNEEEVDREMVEREEVDREMVEREEVDGEDDTADDVDEENVDEGDTELEILFMYLTKKGPFCLILTLLTIEQKFFCTMIRTISLNPVIISGSIFPSGISTV